MESQQNHQAQLFDLCHIGLKAAADVFNTSLKGVASLREQQLSALNEVLASHARIVAEIDNAKGLEELISAPEKLARVNCQAVMVYWNGVFQITGERQTAAAKQVQAQLEKMREKFQQTLIAAPGASVPVIAVLQPVLEMASSVCALNTCAAEEAGRLASTRLEVANRSASRDAKHGRRNLA